MTSNQTCVPASIGVSVSESADLEMLGLSEGHLKEATAEIALSTLSAGWSLVYGGDLRPNGFTDLLLELLGRYQDHPHHHGTVNVRDFVAWPVHARMTGEQLCNFMDSHNQVGEVVRLDLEGSPIDGPCPPDHPLHEPSDEEWSRGLTNMRRKMLQETSARILIGGRVTGFKGRMPGIAEEAMLSLESRQPLYLLGGFGGCARQIAETIGLIEEMPESCKCWPDREFFREYHPSDLCNGLSPKENVLLARTPHIDQAMTLVRYGLRRALNERQISA